MSFTKIAVLGLGKVGTLAATLLREGGFEVTGIDARARTGLPFPTATVDLASPAATGKALAPFEAVLSCLPYHLNAAVAKAAHELGLHYFDLTEDVASSRTVREMAADAPCAFVPQCGLAPGFVTIAAWDLAKHFDQLHDVRLRVGALPR